MLRAIKVERSLAKQALEKAKQHEMELTKQRCLQRIDKIIETINGQLASLLKTTNIQFNVSNADRNQMINDTTKYISQWDGGKNWVKWTDWKECHVKGIRVWWNRIKAWKMGDSLFAPLIFQHLYQFISNLDGLDIPSKLGIFIQILMQLFNTKIRFKQSRTRAIIPVQVFVKKNKFRDLCEEFVANLGVEWHYVESTGNSTKYIADANKSQKLFASYTNCLEIIMTKLSVQYKGKLGAQSPFIKEEKESSETDQHEQQQQNQPQSLNYVRCPRCGNEELSPINQPSVRCKSCGYHFRISQNGISDDIMEKLKILSLAQNLDRKEQIQIVIYCLLQTDGTDHRSLLEAIKGYAPILQAFASSKSDKQIFLAYIEELIMHKSNGDDFLNNAYRIFYCLYHEDIIGEDEMMEWYQSVNYMFSVINQKEAQIIRHRTEPFIKGLQQANDE